MNQKQKSFFKRISTILVVIVLFSVLGYGESKSSAAGNGDAVITYNFISDTFEESNFVVKYRKNVIFKVKNVNPFLYKVTLDGTINDYFPDAPDAFKLIPGGKEGAQKDKEKTKEAINEIIDPASSEDFGLEQKAIDEYIDAYHRLSQITEFRESLYQVLLQNKTFTDINGDVEHLFKALKDDNIKPDRFNVVSIFKKWLEEANEKYGYINFGFLEKESCNSQEIKHLIKKLKTYKSNMDKMKSEKVIDAISDLLNKFQEKNFEHSTIMFAVDADEIHLTMKIEPINEKAPPVPSHILNPIPVRVKSGWTINFSTGILAAINPWEHEYILKDAEGEQNKVVIVEKEKVSVTPTVAALMHVYPRWTGSSGWGGLTFGIGTKDTERIDYYFGTSWIFGVKRRFIINAGISLSKFNVLKPDYDPGQVMDKSDELKAENLVQKEFRPRFFIGFSYNLGKTENKKEIKTGSDEKQKKQNK
jgi:hypothetical protein